MAFSRQEYWSGLPFPPPGDLHDPGMEPESLASPDLAGRFFTTRANFLSNECSFVMLMKSFSESPYVKNIGLFVRGTNPVIRGCEL